MFFVFGPLWFVIVMSVVYIFFQHDEKGKLLLKLIEYVGSFILGVIMILFILWIILFLNGYSTK